MSAYRAIAIGAAALLTLAAHTADAAPWAAAPAFTATYVGAQSVEPGISDIMAGYQYQFEYRLSASAAWSGAVCCVLVDDNDELLALSESKETALAQGQELSQQYTLGLPSTLAPGTYAVALLAGQGTAYDFVPDSRHVLDIVGLSPEAPGVVEYIVVSGLTVYNSTPSEPAPLYYDDQVVSVRLSATTDAWHSEAAIMLAETSTGQFTVQFTNQAFQLAQGESTSLLFDGPWDLLRQGHTYELTILEHGTDPIGKKYYITPKEKDGIAGVTADRQDQPCYNLQGIAIDSPSRGIYIQGDKKFVVRDR